MGKIGIIGAMDVEVEQLKAGMQVDRIKEQAGMTFYEGTLEGTGAVVVRSGVGKVNAAVCAQILIDCFGADTLINTGIAGSLDARIDIGDIVISTDVLHHDMDSVQLGFEPGQIPYMDVFSFAADPQLAQKARQICENVNPDCHVWSGRVVSGDQFIADREKKQRIIQLFGGLCTEMEGAAIAQTAYLNRVPFVVIRSISDKADNSAQMDYPAFMKIAVDHSVRLVKGILESCRKEAS